MYPFTSFRHPEPRHRPDFPSLYEIFDHTVNLHWSRSDKDTQSKDLREGRSVSHRLYKDLQKKYIEENEETNG